MKRLLLLLSILGISILFTNALYAADPVSTTMLVSANVVGTCSVTAVDVNFGDLAGFPSSGSTQGSVSVNCSPDTQYSILLDGGLHWDANGRNMILAPGGPDLIPYQLFTEGGIPWGDGNEEGTGMAPVGGTGTGSLQSYPVVAETQLPYAVPPGAYTDTVTVTVAY